MIAITATRKRIESNENMTLIDKRMILNTLRIRIYIPTAPITDAPILYTHHAHKASTATLKPNFMMISEVREFCFIIFSAFLISLTFFFCVIRRIGRFLFHGQQEVLCFLTEMFFRDKYARPKGKRKIFKKNAKRNIYDKNTIIPLPDEQNDRLTAHDRMIEEDLLGEMKENQLFQNKWFIPCQ